MPASPVTSELDPLACAAFIVAAFVLAGLVQAAWLRSPLSRRLALPLDGRATFRGRRLLGDNKTLRGFAVIVPAAGAAFFLLAHVVPTGSAAGASGLWALSPGGYGLLGLWAGLGFMLGELPNSFVKRQLGIPPGGAPVRPPAKLVCFMADRLDSIAGMLAALSLLVPTPWQTWVCLLVVGPGIHWSFSLLLFALGVKAVAR